MKLENEVCRKVYDHHGVLKSELGSALLEVLTRAKLDREAITTIVNIANATVDTSSSKMATDYQRLFANTK